MSDVQDPTHRLVRLLSREPSLTRLVSIAAAVFLLFSVLSPDVFFSVINFQTIGFGLPEVGFLGLAVMITMLTGGIDLSIVSIANLTALTVGTLFVAMDAANLSGGQAIGVTVLVVLAGLLVGALAGLVNGFLVSVLNVTPILATLGTMQLYNGLAIVWTGGKSIYGLPDVFLEFGIATVAWIPVTFLLFALVAAALGVLLRRTGLGTKLLLVGANPTAARYAAIDLRRVLTSTYVMSGLLAAVAGVIITSRSASASPDYGESYILLAIVIAVLGGTNPLGGHGSVAGVVLATLTLQMLNSGFNIMRLGSFQYTIAQGLVLIFVMVLDVLSQRRRKRRPSAAPPPGDPVVPVASTAGAPHH